jgi:hypothetical protein
MSGYEGLVERAASGQWRWGMVCEGAEIAGGGGYDCEDAAIDALHAALADLSGDVLVMS